MPWTTGPSADLDAAARQFDAEAFKTRIRTQVRRNPATHAERGADQTDQQALEPSERLICFGVAPIAASTASSRSRCATITLKVL